MKFPENLRYTEDHEWIKLDGDAGIVGITDHAQHELGDCVFVDFRVKREEQIEKHGVIATVESVKAVSDVYSPISGNVIDINGSLEGTPEKLNQDPYIGGWIIKILLSNREELSNLMDAKAYMAFIGQK